MLKSGSRAAQMQTVDVQSGARDAQMSKPSMLNTQIVDAQISKSSMLKYPNRPMVQSMSKLPIED
jgi:hypothetical protein